MTQIYNRSSQKLTRKFLRRNMTDEEELLWSRINKKQLLGYKFRRQFSIGSYIVDFYCPKLRLAVEVDGESHKRKDNLEYDDIRQETIESINIHFFRVTNEQVEENIDKVVNLLIEKIKELRSQNHASIGKLRRL